MRTYVQRRLHPGERVEHHLGLSLGGAPLQGIIVDEYLHTIPRYDFIPGFPSRPYSARGYTLDTGRGTPSGPIASWALRRVRGAA